MTCSGDGGVRLWALGVSKHQQALTGHSGRVSGLDFSADGTRIATGGEDGRVLIRDVRSGAILKQLSGHSAAIFDLEFAATGLRFATASRDQTVRIWDADTGAQPLTLAGHAAQVYSVAFQPSGTLLASAGGDRTLRLWNSDNGAPVRTMNVPGGLLNSARFSPDGLQLAVAGRHEAVTIWSVDSGTVVDQLQGDFKLSHDVQFSPDGRLLAVASNDDKIRLWVRHPAQDEPILLQQAARVTTLAFSPDGHTLASGGSDGALYFWDVSTRTVRRYPRHRGYVNRIAFDPSGERIASASDDGILRLWNVAADRPEWRGVALVGMPLRLLTHAGWVDPDSDAGSQPHAPTGWSTELIGVVEKNAQFVAEVSGGGHICVQTWAAGLELWRIGERRAAVTDPAAGVRRLLAHPEGCLLIGAAGAQLVTFDGSAHLLASDGDPSAIAFSGNEILVATGDQIVAFDSRGRRQDSWPIGVGIAAMVQPTGEQDRSLVVGYDNGDVELFPTGAAGTRLAFDQGHSGPVTQMLEGPGGTVVVGYESGDVGLWQRSSGKRLASARLHGSISHLRLVAARLYAATDLGQHLTWDLSDLIRDQCELLGQVWTQVPVVWRDGRVQRAEPDRSHRCWQGTAP
ncbi:MAG: hypothetical protein DRI90_28405 [Deltaproteobacteria bacterium]|nr:MAG: hypothetical protein DRI90_28405 [Deltaproteobacteria bacterium]